MRTRIRCSPAARDGLKRLGADIRNARRSRRLTVRWVAGQAAISRPTLRRIEAGDPAVAIGSYARVLEMFGLVEGLFIVADLRRDPIALAIACGNSPKRIRRASLLAGLNAMPTSEPR
ncbi:MAG TPA: helix-turn-helix domain-containing protein [Steroidobacteraceae bacterium]|nr:helix-turn-helix domain-containing protein [Steroidobacteraceae bacterium]